MIRVKCWAVSIPYWNGPYTNSDAIYILAFALQLC